MPHQTPPGGQPPKLETLGPVHPDDYELIASVVANHNLTLVEIARLKKFDLQRAERLLRSKSGKAFAVWLSRQDPDFIWGLQMAANIKPDAEIIPNKHENIWRFDD